LHAKPGPVRPCRGPYPAFPMKVKTFTGTHRLAVDRQVNDWLEKSNVTVHKTNVAFKALRERGWDAVAGKATTRRAIAIAITVWYDEPPNTTNRLPDTWVFGPPPRR
jgi:hypothetical protein